MTNEHAPLCRFVTNNIPREKFLETRYPSKEVQYQCNQGRCFDSDLSFSLSSLHLSHFLSLSSHQHVAQGQRSMSGRQTWLLHSCNPSMTITPWACMHASMTITPWACMQSIHEHHPMACMHPSMVCMHPSIVWMH